LKQFRNTNEMKRKINIH